MFPSLPPAPDLAELQRNVPTIAPVAADVARPFWSVMIPAYNCAEYLRRTLQSVLVQDPGPDKMQIEVVDDCSTKDDPEAVVRELGKGRVHFFRQPTNQGATRTFNTCIERSKGRWLHILHGDDMLLPGGYEACEQAITAFPECAMIISQVVAIDECDRWIGIMGHLPAGGKLCVVDDFPVLQAVDQQAQFAGLFVRRDAYEQVGGFCQSFGHVADMDMWFRIGLAAKVATLARPYGLYRIHAGSDTSRLMLSGSNIHEMTLLIQANLNRLERQFPGSSARVADWRTRLAKFAEATAWKLDQNGSLEGRLNQARWAWTLRPGLNRFRFLLTSKLRYLLSKLLGGRSR